ncbi:MAG: hypothetical protein E6G41_15290 [Actinobacteria bacterium]|nr:MAG: hypothetical protein E6G41_15290 [Actinomycetota bacterium]
MSGGDVQDTLNELERKLRELQAELTHPGASEPPAAHAGPPMPPYRAPAPQAPPSPPPAAPPPAGGLQDQLDELLRFRDQLSAAATKLVEDYSRILEQLSRVTEDVPAPPPPLTPAAGHATFPVPPPAAPSAESTLFSGHVAIHAGPFEDIAALARFEEALRSVPHAEEVAVRKLKEHRAVVDLHLPAEVPLVFELRRASDQTFDVDHAEAGRLDLTIHVGELPFPVRP